MRDGKTVDETREHENIRVVNRAIILIHFGAIAEIAVTAITPWNAYVAAHS